MKSKRSSKKQRREDEQREDALKRFSAEIKFVLDSLPPAEQLIAILVYERTPMANEDSPFIRMRQLIETPPEDRSKLIEAWRQELHRLDAN